MDSLMPTTSSSSFKFSAHGNALLTDLQNMAQKLESGTQLSTPESVTLFNGLRNLESELEQKKLVSPDIYPYLIRVLSQLPPTTINTFVRNNPQNWSFTAHALCMQAAIAEGDIPSMINYVKFAFLICPTYKIEPSNQNVFHQLINDFLDLSPGQIAKEAGATAFDLLNVMPDTSDTRLQKAKVYIFLLGDANKAIALLEPMLFLHSLGERGKIREVEPISVKPGGDNFKEELAIPYLLASAYAKNEQIKKAIDTLESCQIFEDTARNDYIFLEMCKILPRSCDNWVDIAMEKYSATSLGMSLSIFTRYFGLADYYGRMRWGIGPEVLQGAKLLYEQGLVTGNEKRNLVEFCVANKQFTVPVCLTFANLLTEVQAIDFLSAFKDEMIPEINLQLAALLLKEGNIEEALELFSSIPAGYSPDVSLYITLQKALAVYRTQGYNANALKELFETFLTIKEPIEWEILLKSITHLIDLSPNEVLKIVAKKLSLEPTETIPCDLLFVIASEENTCLKPLKEYVQKYHQNLHPYLETGIELFKGNIHTASAFLQQCPPSVIHCWQAMINLLKFMNLPKPQANIHFLDLDNPSLEPNFWDETDPLVETNPLQFKAPYAESVVLDDSFSESTTSQVEVTQNEGPPQLESLIDQLIASLSRELLQADKWYALLLVHLVDKIMTLSQYEQHSSWWETNKNQLIAQPEQILEKLIENLKNISK